MIEIAVNQYKEDNTIKDIFSDLNILEVDIRKVFTDILESEPIIGLPIDSVSPDLKDWTRTLKNNVKLWVVKKYVEFGDSKNIIYEFPEEYKPVLDTQEEKEIETPGISKTTISTYDVSILDLIKSGLQR